MAGLKSQHIGPVNVQSHTNLNQGRVRKKVEQLGPIENDPEYQLIVEVKQR